MLPPTQRGERRSSTSEVYIVSPSVRYAYIPELIYSEISMDFRSHSKIGFAALFDYFHVFLCTDESVSTGVYVLPLLPEYLSSWNVRGTFVRKRKNVIACPWLPARSSQANWLQSRRHLAEWCSSGQCSIRDGVENNAYFYLFISLLPSSSCHPLVSSCSLPPSLNQYYSSLTPSSSSLSTFSFFLILIFLLLPLPLLLLSPLI
jgi:hypothetical protein